jgi:hypothetical protein
MGKLKLELTHDALHTLSMSGQTKRGTHIRIPKALLEKLLIDHTRLINYVGRDNLEGHL